jgi:anaerobic selenocysteine-containing dehydrogenase
VTKKVIEAPGECRENHYVICELAKRLGAKHRGFDMTAWEIMDETLKKSGMWDAQTNFDRGGQDHVADFETLHFINGFPNSIGKFRFKPDWKRYGGRGAEMPVFPDHFAVIDEATPEKPFRLVAAPARTFLNSTFTETPGSLQREKRPTALINPQDCARLGIAAGELVKLGNEKGFVLVHAQPKDGQQPGVLVVEGIWPNRNFEGGIGINRLTSAEPGYPIGGAVFHDTAVWLRKA